VKIQEKLIQRNPARNSWRQALGAMLLDLSAVQQLEKQSAEELDSLRRADEIYAGLQSSDPGNPEYRRLRGKSLSLLGGALVRNNEGSGEEQFAQALELRRKLTEEFPEEAEYLEAEISSHKDLSKALAARGLTAESEAELKRACDGQRRLAEEFHGDAKYVKPLAGLLAKLAGCAQRRNAWPEARDLYSQAMQAAPLPEYRKAFIEGALEARDYGAVVQEAKAMSLSTSGGWGARVRGAEFIATALPMVAQDASLEETKRTALVESYGGSVVELLQLAVKQGYADVAAFDTAPLGERSDFQSLLRETATASSTGAHHFRYDRPNDPDPGVREWERDGATWTETQPSGAKSTFTVIGRTVVEKTRGTEIRRNGKGGSSLFIPDPDTPEPHFLRIKSSSGTWGAVGKIEEMR
jgi:tetratricopeptide (TPR) repeat protein